MNTTITITPEHGYVLAVMALTGFVAQWHGFVAGSARRASKVQYPNAYASNEEAEKDTAKYTFNCVQRAHSNYMENLLVVLPLMITSGAQYPVATASLGSVWLVGRIVYTLGYRGSKLGDNGKGRYKGMFYNIGQLGLMITSGMSIWSLCCPK